MRGFVLSILAALSGGLVTDDSTSTDIGDGAIVAQHDTEFQAAVKRNGATTMSHILHPRMVLVLGNGTVVSREEQLQEARECGNQYELQEEEPGTQIVRLWENTAVVTARLWIKGTRRGKAFDRRLWFGDTYARTADGWRYVFGQASTPLADSPVP